MTKTFGSGVGGREEGREGGVGGRGGDERRDRSARGGGGEAGQDEELCNLHACVSLMPTQLRWRGLQSTRHRGG